MHAERDEGLTRAQRMTLAMMRYHEQLSEPGAIEHFYTFAQTQDEDLREELPVLLLFDCYDVFASDYYGEEVLLEDDMI